MVRIKAPFHVMVLAMMVGTVAGMRTNDFPLSKREISRREVAERSAAGIGFAYFMPWLHFPEKAAANTIDMDIASRLMANELKQPPTTNARGKGIDNTVYPNWMAGTWDATQTLVNIETPLGLVYLGGPNGDTAIAEKTLAESKRQLRQPVQLQLRYVPTQFGVLEDRAFNTKTRLNAFAGRSVVRSSDYADVGNSNRPAVLAVGGTATDPLQTTLTYFTGPAAQKVFVTSHRAEPLDNLPWHVDESIRTLFALTNESTAPPIFTDQELMWEFSKIDDTHISAKLRIAAYLNPRQDKLYFEAQQRAVSLQDYTLELVKQRDM